MDLLEKYPLFNIKKVFIRKALMIGSRFPKFIPTSQLALRYKDVGLIPIRTLNERTDNVIIDIGFYLNAIEAKFGPGRYLRTAVRLPVENFLNNIRGIHTGRIKVLFYAIDMNKPFPKSIYDKRIWPILDMYRNEEQFPFDYFLIGLLRDNEIRYTLFGNQEETLQFTRIRNFLNMLKPDVPGWEEETESETAASKVANLIQITPNPPDAIDRDDTPDQLGEETEDTINTVTPDVKEIKKEEERGVINKAVTSFLNISPANIRRGILRQRLDKDSVLSLATKAILFNVSGDLEKATKVVDETPPEKLKYLFDETKKELLKDVVHGRKGNNNSRLKVVENVKLDTVLQGKNPSHILNKRKIDFSTSFESDLKNSLKLMSKGDYPLKLKNIKKSFVPVDPGDLNPSYYDSFSISLEDDKGRNHNAEIQIPKLMEDGTFMINGKKKYLVYQIILDPIFFIKPGQAKLETLYAPISIHRKQTKLKDFFTILIGGYKMPLMALMGHYLGLERTCKLFDIKYSIKDHNSDTEKPFFELMDGKFLHFDWNNDYAAQLVNSIYEMPLELTSETLFDKDVFTKSIIKVTGNRNCIFKIDQVLSNIMEPVATQILKTKLLPFTLPQIILYICQELMKGRVDDRNDASKQRIRSSEVFVSQIQSLILGAYTDYRTRRISGDDKAEYRLDVTQAVKEVVNSKLVRDLENINPIEELSCLTRITPVGEGGIPDARAMTDQARGVHASYYGNIDSMDTPEGGNIGIINQLAIGALITSARGSIIDQSKEKDLKAGALGVNSAMIPFIGSTDGCRVMFSGSQGRQSIPINGVEPPIVQTGYESLFTDMLSDAYIKRADDDGKIGKITENSIIIILKTQKKQVIDLSPVKLQSGQGLSALNYFKVIVKQGQSVRKGQIVAEGKHIVDGVISQGTNLLCAIMTWKGYSYEDGYIISDKIAKEKFTSSAFHQIEVLIKREDKVNFIISEGAETKRGEPLLIRTSREVEDIVGLDEDELVHGQIITKSPGGKIISLEIYPNSGLSRFPTLQEPFQKFKTKYEETKGPMPKKFTSKIGSSKEQFSGVLIKFNIEDQQAAELGDKITNSFGGKGVIAKIEKEENMPLTPWGEHVDVILNPIAIINRMNPATIKELQISLVSKFLARKIAELGLKKNDRAVKLISEVLTVLDNTKDKLLSRNQISALRSMNPKQYADFIQEMVNRNYFFPIIVPPFQEPKLADIQKAMTIVGAKSEYHLTLKEFGTKTMRPIAVGYLYYKKLEQQSGIKMSARSTGLVDPRTRQATAGKKSGGGQKIGEMDSWSIINHGATNVLREFFGPLSDDHVTKNQIIADIIQTGTAEYRTPRSSPTKEIFDVFLHGMMLEPDLGE